MCLSLKAFRANLAVWGKQLREDWRKNWQVIVPVLAMEMVIFWTIIEVVRIASMR